MKHLQQQVQNSTWSPRYAQSVYMRCRVYQKDRDPDKLSWGIPKGFSVGGDANVARDTNISPVLV
jgi:hypothetical protein